MPKVIACGGRRKAYNSFCHEVARAGGDSALLLVDSEGPVQTENAWDHLRQCDEWERPDDAGADTAHLMVQVMESWFLADREALAGYFGQNFIPGALPQGTQIEDISKTDVLRGIRNASWQTNKPYDKGRDSFEILRRLDVSLITAACPRAGRLIKVLQS